MAKRGSNGEGECNAREKIFARVYVENGMRNLTDAGVAAGWGKQSRNLASQAAYRAVKRPRVVREIERQKALFELDYPKVDRNRSRRHLEMAAMARLTDVIDWDAAGNITLKPAKDIPGQVHDGIVRVRVTEGKYGRSIEAQVADKIGANLALAKLEGFMAPSRLEQSGPGGRPLSMIFREFSNEQLGLTEDGIPIEDVEPEE